MGWRGGTDTASLLLSARLICRLAAPLAYSFQLQLAPPVCTGMRGPAFPLPMPAHASPMLEAAECSAAAAAAAAAAGLCA